MTKGKLFVISDLPEPGRERSAKKYWTKEEI